MPVGCSVVHRLLLPPENDKIGSEANAASVSSNAQSVRSNSAKNASNDDDRRCRNDDNIAADAIQSPLQMIAQNLTVMELKNFLEEFIRGLFAETPPIVAASGAVCIGLRQTLPTGFSKDNALGFTNRTLGGLIFWVGLQERLMAFSKSKDMQGRSSFSCPEVPSIDLWLLLLCEGDDSGGGDFFNP
nr:hypothetical protein Iba_chr03bCG5450 [Ipomoea batatas]